MVFTANQNTLFFTSNAQIALTNEQRIALRREGLVSVQDLLDFQKEDLKVAFRNVRTGIPGSPATPAVAAIPAVVADGVVIQAEVPATPGTAAIPTVLPVPIPARSTSRLLIASVAYHYYRDTGRTITPVNMHFTNVLRDFNIEWQALETMADNEAPSLPLLSKNNPPLKWCESFKQYLYSKFGVRKVPLLYVIRDNVEVTPEADDPLQTGKAYGASGSVLTDLISRLSHNHPLYRSDNANLYAFLEEAARNSTYASTIKPFAQSKNGRKAWFALITSHVGMDKWEKIERDNSAWLMTSKWNGKRYSLESFCSQHRSRYLQLEEASIHTKCQLPNEHTRVGYLLDNIDTSDAGLQVAVGSIRQNHNNLRDNFEASVATLLPVDPYVKSNASKKPAHYEVSSVTSNTGRGSKTGVDLRWYKPEEYKTLSTDAKKELREWQGTNDGKAAIATSKDLYFKNKSKRKGKDVSNPGQSKRSKHMARISALEKTVADQAAKLEDQSKLAEIASTIKSNKSTSSSDQLSLARTIMSIASRQSDS